ncbi:MAG: hypothetical protein KGI79_00815 [Patescibacteria group bacterium]|nr:hypothetical protein [Patescibacteria group bacterium]MDE2116404.1 hypothetical protein [Patescibacteria group bacterium]
MRSAPYIHVLSATIVSMVVIVSLGAPMAFASEITGRLSTASASDQSSQPSSMVGVLAANVSPSSAPAASRSGGSARTNQAQTAAVESDGSLAPASDYSYDGTGGGYDPALDTYLASLQGADTASGAALTPQDAIAYNTAGAATPNAPESNLAAAAASQNAKSEMAVTVALGAAVVVLAGYAVSAYLGYRRERDM